MSLNTNKLTHEKNGVNGKNNKMSGIRQPRESCNEHRITTTTTTTQ